LLSLPLLSSNGEASMPNISLFHFTNSFLIIIFYFNDINLISIIQTNSSPFFYGNISMTIFFSVWV
jgi:hypothetical protein